MIAVTHYKVGKIALIPLVKKACIVTLGLAPAPHVKSLIHHEYAHAVAQSKHFGSRRIM